MGIGIVLIVYAVALSILAACCSGVLVALTLWCLRNISVPRSRVLLLVGAFPFACVVYAGVWFITYAIVNDTVFHHDPMIGDGWYTNIPNGYAIDMIDVTDQGTVHPTDGPDRGLNSLDGVSGVRRMQVAGAYIFGTRDTNWFGNLGQQKSDENAFFAIHTATRKRTDFATEAELVAYAAQAGVKLDLKPIADVYDHYRMNWFEPVAGAVLVVVPAFGFFWLVRSIVRLKHKTLANLSA